MKFKRNLIIPVLLLFVFLAGCNINLPKKKDPLLESDYLNHEIEYKTTEDREALKVLVQILQAVDDNDPEAIKSLFSKKALREIDDIDAKLRVFIDTFPKWEKKYNPSFSSCGARLNHGKDTKWTKPMFIFESEGKEYILHFSYYYEADEDEDMLGMMYLQICDRHKDNYSEDVRMQGDDSAADIYLWDYTLDLDERKSIMNEEANENKIYVAIGDSLTHGYGLADKKNDRFSAVATSKLNADGNNYVEFNYGVDGLTSEGLLKMLQNGEIGMIENADVITIDIGANDIVHSMESFLYAAIYTGELSPEEYARTIGSYSASINTAKENTEKIVKYIREVNPNARIICLTIFNPYKNMDITLTVGDEKISLAEYTDGLVKELNANIISIAEAHNSEVGDWYTAFELTNLNVLNACSDPGFENYDIHPNKDGYALMGTVVYEKIKK